MLTNPFEIAKTELSILKNEESGWNLNFDKIFRVIAIVLIKALRSIWLRRSTHLFLSLQSQGPATRIAMTRKKSYVIGDGHKTNPMRLQERVHVMIAKNKWYSPENTNQQFTWGTKFSNGSLGFFWNPEFANEICYTSKLEVLDSMEPSKISMSTPRNLSHTKF